MSQTCSGTLASDRFGIVHDFVTKLHNGSISDEEAKRFLRREDPFRMAPTQKNNPLKLIVQNALDATSSKKTAECFMSSRYTYRDSAFDRLLPVNQPAMGTSIISTLASTKEGTFAEWAATILGVSAYESVETLGGLLKAGGHTMTLPQVEKMVGLTEIHEQTGVRTDSRANCFFLENENGGVSIGYVVFDVLGWRAFTSGLDEDSVWLAGVWILVRNLDRSKL